MAVKRKSLVSTQDLSLEDPMKVEKTPYVAPAPTQPAAPQASLAPGGVEGAPSGSVYQPDGTVEPPPPVGRTTPYNPAAGWEVSRLNDPSADSTKYQFGRAAQDYTGGYGRGNLQGLVDYFNTTYNGHARVLDDDEIDFGESYGPADVLNANGDYLQWVVGGRDAQSGGGAGGGAANALSSAVGSFPSLASQLSSRALGSTPTMPSLSGLSLSAPPAGTSGGGGGSAADPFARLIDYYEGRLGDRGNTAASIEAARAPYEVARRSQLANARGDLANRGLLSEPGHLQGPEVTAIQRIEEGLAPAYTAAIADRIGAQDRLEQENAAGLFNALQGSSGRDVALQQIALQSLEQTRLWQQFLGEFGLNAAQVRYDMEHGNMEQYLQLLELWLRSAEISANGFI